MRPTDHELEFEPGPPNHEDACMVCDQIECVCPPEEDIIPPLIRLSLRIILNHVEPGWENNKAVVEHWLEETKPR